MKRKVIQIAGSTQLVSLPRKWALRHDIKKGDEVEVKEEGNKITISTEKVQEGRAIEIDVTNLDRTTILYHIQNLYRGGYDEIKIHFNKPTTYHFRAGKEINTITVIHNEVNRLVGYEVIQQKENFCVIKDLSSSSIQEFESVVRRIFLLMDDASNDLLKGAKEMNKSLIESIEEKHNSITKFISYCLRLLNKYGHMNHKKTLVEYHILATYDKVIDVLKNAGRDLLNIKRISKSSLEILMLIDDSIKLFSKYYYKFDPSKVKEIYSNRDKILRLLSKNKEKISRSELILLSKAEHALELIVDMDVAKMGIEV